MNILFLYGNEITRELLDWLISRENSVIATSEKIDRDFIMEHKIQLVISYTYRYILNTDILEAVNYNAINLHISYLPWNRGANPNQWSLIDDTPKGVTVHYIDSNIDTGDIISQKLVSFKENDTLKSMYLKLNFEIVQLFKQLYPLYPFWNGMRKKAVGKGSYHSIDDFSPYAMMIHGNYDITASEFGKKAAEMRKIR